MRYKLIAVFTVAILAVITALVVNFSGKLADTKQMETPSDTEETSYAYSYDGSAFTSSLPLVLIETSDGNMPATTEPIWCNLYIIDNESGENCPGDQPALSVVSTIRIRGNSSLTFSKKSYRIECYTQTGGDNEKNVSILGMAEESDWVLNGPYLDHTQMRNKLIYDVSRELMEWAPDSRFCELYVNGVYRGIYVVIESIKASESRLDLTDYSLLSGKTSYILEGDRWGSETNVIDDFGMEAGYEYFPFSVKFPNVANLTSVEEQWITSDFSEIQRVLYSDYFDDPERGYTAYLDVDSFATYYLINEFAMNIDIGYWSTFYYKDLNGKLMAGPVWDFNNAFDHFVGEELSPNGFYVADNGWFARLLQDRAFADVVCRQWREMRAGVLSDEALLAQIDNNVNLLGDAITRNFEVYQSTFVYGILERDESEQITSYEMAIDQLKTCIVEHGAFMDENIEKLYNYCIN